MMHFFSVEIRQVLLMAVHAVDEFRCNGFAFFDRCGTLLFSCDVFHKMFLARACFAGNAESGGVAQLDRAALS